MRWVLALSLIALVAPSAPACINDREIETHEREFKSHYHLGPQPSPDPSPSPGGTNPAYPLIAGSSGLALLVGSAVVLRRRPVV
jgi:hypothetical protein